ncbi:hypothetical protein OPQ81_010410 [Rhizoctonia solani]|nr:hypothetical protein OPQ81_010410 [Rhizoctonia solani]
MLSPASTSTPSLDFYTPRQLQPPRLPALNGGGAEARPHPHTEQQGEGFRRQQHPVDSGLGKVDALQDLPSPTRQPERHLDQGGQHAGAAGYAARGVPPVLRDRAGRAVAEPGCAMVRQDGPRDEQEGGRARGGGADSPDSATCLMIGTFRYDDDDDEGAEICETEGSGGAGDGEPEEKRVPASFPGVDGQVNSS